MKKSKIMDIIKTIYSILFVLALIVFFIVLTIKNMAVMIPLIIVILIIILCLVLSIRKDEKKAKEYRSDNISEIKFEKDSLKNTITCKSLNISFGKYTPYICITDYDEREHELYFRNLEYLYNKQDIIINNLLNGFLDAYSNTKDINELKQGFIIDSIVISKYDEYFLQDIVLLDTDDNEDFSFIDNYPDDLVISVNSLTPNYYSHPTAYMDCISKKTLYTLEE